ncbi:DUF72 domain-containing protein [Candidatus Bathyarchaeota archaeon]|nr:DUF72 domain-containing protein [Candidatus Bathyarchaeota archaeon]
MKTYFEKFNLVELQSTFYRLPKLNTAKNWRARAPEEFEFSMKGFQGLTHPTSSPTWRRSGLKFNSEESKEVGFLRPTRTNFEYWRKTKEVAEALKARTVVLQCPPSFTHTDENVESMTAFFKTINRGNLIIGWEPRHDSWRPNIIRELCMELNLIHVVDPFKSETQTYDINPVYYRLHGLGSRPYNYKYTNEDLRILYERYVKPIQNYGLDIYILWNNIYMGEDALIFKQTYLI